MKTDFFLIQAYRTMGNLHHPGALPLYVTKYNHSNADNSNIDRIVDSVASDWNHKWFDRIYETTLESDVLQ